jgi:lipoteichoic acid synthase
MGSDLLSEKHREVVPFRNGDFISPEFTQVEETCYYTETGEIAEASACAPLSDQAKKELDMSDNIVYKDLLRFYQPEGFVPVNRNDFSYVKKEEPYKEERNGPGLQK